NFNHGSYKIDIVNPNKLIRYIQENIDNFRNFSTGYTGPYSDIFTKEKTIKNKDGNDVQVFANRKPKECLGFQPGDVYNDFGNYYYNNGNISFGGNSKIFCDILFAQNAKEAMDLAF